MLPSNIYTDISFYKFHLNSQWEHRKTLSLLRHFTGVQYLRWVQCPHWLHCPRCTISNVYAKSSGFGVNILQMLHNSLSTISSLSPSSDSSIILRPDVLGFGENDTSDTLTCFSFDFTFSNEMGFKKGFFDGDIMSPLIAGFGVVFLFFPMSVFTNVICLFCKKLLPFSWGPIFSSWM